MFGQSRKPVLLELHRADVAQRRVQSPVVAERQPVNHGKILHHSRYRLHDHVRKGNVADDKNLNGLVDELAKAQRGRLTLAAQIKHQDAQRAMGIFQPDTHPSPPPRAGCACSSLSLSPIPTGHLYLAEKGTSLLWVDTNVPTGSVAYFTPGIL